MTVPNRSHAGGAKPTALAGSITNAVLTFTVTAGGGTGYPDGSGGVFIVCVDQGLAGEEKILCSARSVDTFTVPIGGRGYDNTAASAHANLAGVTHVFSATEADEINDHILGTTAAHAASAIAFTPAGTVGATTVQAAIEEVATEAALTKVFLPAPAFFARAGSPVETHVNNRWASWDLDPTVAGGLTTEITVPSGWNTVHVDLYWSNNGAGSGDVVWDGYTDNYVDGDTTAEALTTYCSSVAITAPAQNTLKVSRIGTGVAVATGGVQAFLIDREAANVGDTLANVCSFVGLLLTKAS